MLRYRITTLPTNPSLGTTLDSELYETHMCVPLRIAALYVGMLDHSSTHWWQVGVSSNYNPESRESWTVSDTNASNLSALPPTLSTAIDRLLLSVVIQKKHVLY
jgi:hypothetical protein